MISSDGSVLSLGFIVLGCHIQHCVVMVPRVCCSVIYTLGKCKGCGIRYATWFYLCVTSAWEIERHTAELVSSSRPNNRPLTFNQAAADFTQSDVSVPLIWQISFTHIPELLWNVEKCQLRTKHFIKWKLILHQFYYRQFPLSLFAPSGSHFKRPLTSHLIDTSLRLWSTNTFSGNAF